MSEEDSRFIKIAEESIHQQEDEHFALPLSFKEKKPKAIQQ